MAEQLKRRDDVRDIEKLNDCPTDQRQKYIVMD